VYRGALLHIKDEFFKKSGSDVAAVLNRYNPNKFTEHSIVFAKTQSEITSQSIPREREYTTVEK
jgi:hypothetical protein